MSRPAAESKARSASAFEALEATWAEAMRVFGDLVVARTRGAPIEPERGSTRALARRFHALRRELDPLIAQAIASETGALERRATETIRDGLAWFGEWEPVRARVGTDQEAGGSDDDAATGNLRRTVFRRYGRAASAVPVGSETLDRMTVMERLARLEDPAQRRRHFEALAQVWRAIDGDGVRSPYRELVRATARRWDRLGSPIEAAATAIGLAEGSLEPMLWSILEAWRTVVGPTPTEPWDHWFASGAAARRLDSRIPIERLRPLNDAFLVSIGADPARLQIGYDVFSRPDRSPVPVAFSIDRGFDPDEAGGGWRARPAWVFATYETGGLGNLLELLHESGHAIHTAAIRARPAFAGYPMASSGFIEAIADVVGWDVDEPAWQQHWLGDAATPREAARHRYGAVVLEICWALFEIEVHRSPDRRPNDVWAEIASRGIGLVPHPEWSWWAMRGQLIDDPGYLANYALSAIVAAAVRGRLRELRGDWSAGDPGWYEAVSAALFEMGSERAPADLLRDLLGGPVTAEPLLADLRRAAG